MSSTIERFGINTLVHILIDSIYVVCFSEIESNEDFEDPTNKLPLKNKGIKERSVSFLHAVSIPSPAP